ncbi:Ger(x)C family spore germination protein [Lutispora sp.]|uniref:Ger(x)C family spore germination protein n=1 Tax=Lutispora sp. TaxID=2828727 RepID=UPI002B1EBB42|nr:Ger(x)C family spore germination protein [Lutispora sp.]MEA4961818.1 Ger(x)C family spore germination protein [Lutispora sp.]
MIKKNKSIVILIICIVIYIIISPDEEMLSIEDMDIPSGVGYDVIKDSQGEITYSIPINVYIFGQQEKISQFIRNGVDRNITLTRKNRQTKSNRKFVLGLEKIILLSEELSGMGIRSVGDVLIKNPDVNDIGLMAVCKGKTEDFFRLNIEGYATSSDYIEGMIQNSKNNNFFSDKYKFIDAFVRIDAEGRSLVLPYMEIIGGMPHVTGTAIFDKDRMIAKLDMYESRIMNLMRENKVRGILWLEGENEQNVNFQGKSKRKVKCTKNGDRYVFTIDLTMEGEIVENDMYVDIDEDPQKLKKLEEDLALKLKEMCNEFISKMQQEYGRDFLELGWVGAAKFGRGQGTDWNEAVSKAKIEVNTKIVIERLGRGKY